MLSHFMQICYLIKYHMMLNIWVIYQDGKYTLSVSKLVIRQPEKTAPS